jgi:hypothetical protein
MTAMSACKTTALGIALVLLLPATAAAQGSDAHDPFLGTWSGVFTTQDDEHWGLEEFACFVGCPPVTRDTLKALLADPANDERPFSDLMGEAIGASVGQFAAILTPLGRQIQAENTSENDPKLLCQPYGFVRQATNPLPLAISRNGEHLWVEYEEWSLLRPIFMDGREHPQFRTPSLIGHSVGRVENGVLVVETARVLPDRISDFTQGGYSDELTAVERYSVRENPRRMELELTITDPVTLTTPYVISKVWLATPEIELVQDRCSEFPGKF